MIKKINLLYLEWDGTNYDDILKMFSSVHRSFDGYISDGTLVINDVSFRIGESIGITDNGDIVKIF